MGIFFHNPILKQIYNQKGAAHLLALMVIVTTIGLVSFLLLTTLGPFKGQIGTLYPKNPSLAAEDGAKQETTVMLETAQKFQRGDKTVLNQLRSSSNQRKQHLKNLITDHPEIFLQITMPQKLSNSLPTEIQTDLEQDITAQGTFYVSHSDDIVHSTANYDYSLIQADGKTLSLHFGRNTPKIISGAKVKIKGIRLDDDVVLDSALDKNSFQVLQASPAQSTNILGTQATKKMAVIMVTLSGGSAMNFTANDVRNALFNNILSANNYYSATSYGKVTFSGRDNANGDVYGTYSIPVSTTTACQGTSQSLTTLGNAAESAAQTAGVNLVGYDEVIYWFPFVSSCSFAGVSFFGPGPKGHGQSAMNGYYFTAQWGTQEYSIVAHELGHYLGVDHAGAWDCTNGSTRVAISPTCTHIEYGDPFDNMGNHDGNDNSFNTVTNLYHQGHNFHRQVWNFISGSNLQTITSSGSYTLTPVESGNGVNTLAIARGGSQFYYLEYRQPNANFDNFLSTDSVVNGVTIRVVPTSSNGIVKTELIDNTPATTTYMDSSLRVGQTFTDSPNNISITTQSVSASSATVQVNLPATLCSRVNPTVLVTPLSQFGTPGSGLNYSVQVTNNDSTPCGSEQFNITSTTPGTGWIQLPSSQTLTVAPGATSSGSFTLISPSNAAAGFYTFSEKATNSQAASFISQASANYNINAVPTPTPTPTVNPTPTPAPTSTPTFGLSMNPSFVNISVVAGGTTQAFSLTSTRSTSFVLFGYPTTFGAGINWNPASGGIPLNVPFPILIQVNNSVPANTYTGTGVLKNDLGNQITFPVTVRVTAPTPSPTPIPTPSPTSVPLIGDLDGDRDVDIFDYSILVTNFGKTGTNIQGDLDKDGDVDIFDYSALVTNFGKTG